MVLTPTNDEETEFRTLVYVYKVKNFEHYNVLRHFKKMKKNVGGSN